MANNSKWTIFLIMNIFLVVKTAPTLNTESREESAESPLTLSSLCTTTEPCWSPLRSNERTDSLYYQGNPKFQAPSEYSKKNVLISQGLRVGGMPFSVLYMNPYNSRSNHGSTSLIPSRADGSSAYKEIMESAETKLVTNINNKQKDGSGTGSKHIRRKYSTIPQLFISYGWAV